MIAPYWARPAPLSGKCSSRTPCTSSRYILPVHPSRNLISTIHSYGGEVGHMMAPRAFFPRPLRVLRSGYDLRCGTIIRCTVLRPCSLPSKLQSHSSLLRFVLPLYRFHVNLMHERHDLIPSMAHNDAVPSDTLLSSMLLPQSGGVASH